MNEMRKQFEPTQADLSQKSEIGLPFVRELESGKGALRLDKVNQVLALTINGKKKRINRGGHRECHERQRCG